MNQTRILFVCLGNICRLPMAEFVMKELVRKAGREPEFYIESAATSFEEIGNPVYPPARRGTPLRYPTMPARLYATIRFIW